MIPRREWRLRTALVALLALSAGAALLTLVVVGGGLWMWQLPRLKAQESAQVQREARQLAERMEALLGSLQGQLEQAAAAVNLVPNASSERLLDSLTGKAGEAFEAVYVADRRGIVELASVSPESTANRADLVGIDISANQLYRLAQQHRATVWSGKFLSALSGGVTVGAAVRAGARVVIAELPLDQLVHTVRLAAKDPRFLIWVVDSRGELVAETGSGPRLGPTNVLGSPTVKAAIRGEPLPDVLDIRNVSYLPAVQKSRIVDWYFVVMLPAGLNNPNIRSTALLVVVSLLSSLAIGALLAPFVAGWIARPLHDITMRARQVAQDMPSGEWPRGPIAELNALALDLETMASHLQERRERFHAIFNASPVPMAVAETEGEGKLLDVNDAWVRQFRHRREDSVGRSLRELLWAEDAGYRYVLVRALHEGRGAEAVLNDSSGRPLHCAISARIARMGGRTLAIWVIEDISERRESEEALRDSQASLIEAQRVAGIGSWERELASDRVSWSEGLHRILGRDPGLGAPALAELPRLYTPESWQRLQEAMGEAIERGTPYELELEMHRADGSRMWAATRGEAVRSADGRVVKLRGTVHDVTERRRAYERIQGALAEKEVLLKEIYHRVKNNLQVVSSLLNLQSRRLADSEAKRVLDDSASRVTSMALVHEQLYRAENLSSIGLREYLGQLSEKLVSVHRPLSTRVRLALEADDLNVAIENAIPLGLAINELVSNAYRHGYAADAAGGQIVLRVSGLPDGRVSLEVKDDGRGLPEGFDPRERGSLGLQLVLTLARQLGGELAWEAGRRGASFSLRFSPDQPAMTRKVA